jgi:hyperosmotically inducible protein
MKPTQKRSAVILSSLAMLLALAACDRADNPTVGERTGPDASTSQRAGAEVKQDAKDATASAGAAVDKAAEEAKQMGATAGEKIDDATITAKINASLAADKDLSAIKIDVDTQNGVVTLSGPAPSATARERASEIARSVKGVNSVNNQLTVKAG